MEYKPPVKNTFIHFDIFQHEKPNYKKSRSAEMEMAKQSSPMLSYLGKFVPNSLLTRRSSVSNFVKGSRITVGGSRASSSCDGAGRLGASFDASLPPESSPAGGDGTGRMGASFDTSTPSKGSPAGGQADPKTDASNKGEAFEATEEAEGADRKPSWSLGAAGHDEGTCRPCAWHYKPSGCSNGIDCEFCHMCEKEEVKRRKKERYIRRAIAKREMREMEIDQQAQALATPGEANVAS